MFIYFSQYIAQFGHFGKNHFGERTQRQYFHVVFARVLHGSHYHLFSHAFSVVFGFHFGVVDDETRIARPRIRHSSGFLAVVDGFEQTFAFGVNLLYFNNLLVFSVTQRARRAVVDLRF